MRLISGMVLLALCLTGILAPIQRPAAQAQTPTPFELHEGLIGQINKLNPLFAGLNPVDRDITSLIYEGLTTINAYGEIVPDLAAEWQVSADGRDYIVRLRQDVLWQDGIAFTSADVAYTINTLRSSDFPGDPELTHFWRTIEMDVIDDFTIRFSLVQPLAAFPEYLRQGIVPAHALEGAPVAGLGQHPFNLSPIGTGAYQLESLFTEQGQIKGVSLRVAPNYRLRPEGATGYQLDRLVFRTYPTVEDAIAGFQRGEINSIGSFPADRVVDLNTLPNSAVYTGIAPGLGVLIYNLKRDSLAYFRDSRMRRAFALATEREAAVMHAMPGRVMPTNSPILPTSWAYNPATAYPAYNLAEAQALMGQVSFEPATPPEPPPAESMETAPTPEGGATELPPPADIRRDFKIMVVDDPGIAGVAFEIAGQWSQLGFTVTLDMVDAATLLTRLESGDFDVALVEFSFAPKADPDQFTLWHEGQYQVGQNYGGLRDRLVSDLLLQARVNWNGVLRKQLYDQFQVAFARQAPALVLYNPLYIYVTDAGLQGVQLNFLSSGADRFNNIQDWYWQ